MHHMSSGARMAGSSSAGNSSGGAAGGASAGSSTGSSPLVVRVVVPTKKGGGQGDGASDSSILMDQDQPPEEVISALKRTALLAQNPKFLSGSAKSMNPVIKSVLGVLKFKVQDEAVQLAVLSTLADLTRAVKAVSIIIRLEGGVVPICSLVAANASSVSYQRHGCACIAAMCSSPQTAAAAVKAGALGPAIQVLLDKQSATNNSPSAVDAAVQALGIMTAIAKCTDGSLVGTMPVLQAVVSCIYARIAAPRVIAAATDFLSLLVRRPGNAATDGAVDMCHRHIDAITRAGGVDAMFVIVGRYSESFELFKGAYFVLNRLLRKTLTSDLLGEYPESRQHIDPEKKKWLMQEDPFRGDLCFPEMDDDPLTARNLLDSEHTLGCKKGHALPPFLTGCRPMVKEGGISYARAKAGGVSGGLHSSIREPFVPPGPDVLAEVMLLNVARWLRTSSIVERDVYCAYHPEYSMGDVLFDCSRKLVWGGREWPGMTTDPDAMSPAPAPASSDTGLDAGDEDVDAPSGVRLAGDPWDRSDSGAMEGGSWPGGVERVSRSAMKHHVQRDTVSDASDGDEIVDGDDDGEGEDGDGEVECERAKDGRVDETGRSSNSVLRLGGEKGGPAAASPSSTLRSLGAGESVTGDDGAFSDELNRNTLLFDSRFEGGNLGRAVQVHEFEYDLFLMPDTNTMAGKGGGNTQWYYFAVTNMRSDVEYKFNIVNLVKPDSLYNIGMRPAFFSAMDNVKGKSSWKRTGERISYYENQYETESGTPYYTLTFTITFPNAKDVCYLAHCFPYGYSDLSACLNEALSRPGASKHIQMSTMCNTLAGNKCPSLTITNFTSPASAIQARRAICLSARVHPGETCASWAMHGFIEFICGGSARARILRDNFIFKVVPMLNPDGVINGNYRCSLSGQDLNRQWQNPDRIFHPTIFCVKQLLRGTKSARDISIYCDIHGHSRKCNMFMYGCASKAQSQRLKERVFPYLLHNDSLMFNYDDCNFKVQRCKEGSARVVVWRDYGVNNSYTLEMSLGGGDFGEDTATRPPFHFSMDDYISMGRLFCEGILDLYDPGRVRFDAAMAELEQLHPEVKKQSAAQDDDDGEGDGGQKAASKLSRGGTTAKKVGVGAGSKPGPGGGASGRGSSALLSSLGSRTGAGGAKSSGGGVKSKAGKSDVAKKSRK